MVLKIAGNEEWRLPERKKKARKGEMAPEKRTDGDLCRDCEVGKPCRLCFFDCAR